MLSLLPRNSRGVLPDLTTVSWLALSALDSFIRRNKSLTIFWSSCTDRNDWYNQHYSWQSPPSELFSRRYWCRTPGISAWGSPPECHWTWCRALSWTPESQCVHPATRLIVLLAIIVSGYKLPPESAELIEILKQSPRHFVIASYKEGNMRFLLRSLIKIFASSAVLKVLDFCSNQGELLLPCWSRTFWRCVSPTSLCQLQGSTPSSSCERIFWKFCRQDAFWGSSDTEPGTFSSSQ